MQSKHCSNSCYVPTQIELPTEDHLIPLYIHCGLKDTKKSCFYIAQYPVRWTAQSALHFLPSLENLFIPTHQLGFSGKHSSQAAITRQGKINHISTTTGKWCNVQSSPVTSFALSNDSPDESIHLHPGKILGVCIKGRVRLKRGYIEFKYHAYAIHSGHTPPG